MTRYVSCGRIPNAANSARSHGRYVAVDSRLPNVHINACWLLRLLSTSRYQHDFGHTSQAPRSITGMARSAQQQQHSASGTAANKHAPSEVRTLIVLIIECCYCYCCTRIWIHSRCGGSMIATITVTTATGVATAANNNSQ